MARENPDAGGCQHPLPIEVVSVGDGRRARCLRCGWRGPVRPDAEGALRALRSEASHREKVGA